MTRQFTNALHIEKMPVITLICDFVTLNLLFQNHYFREKMYRLSYRKMSATSAVAALRQGAPGQMAWLKGSRPPWLAPWLSPWLTGFFVC